jgi:L-2,4-diaminobutyrate decarboxylase
MLGKKRPGEIYPPLTQNRIETMTNNTKGLLYSGASPKEVAEDLKPLVDFQEEGLSFSSLQKLINERLVPHLMLYDRSEFQSMFNAFPEEGAGYGAQVALTYNQGVTNWQVSPGGAVLEELCCQALCRLFDLSPGSDATFMYCGTYANQQALYLALHTKAEREGFDLRQKGLKGFKNPSRLTVLTSTDAHFSLKHAVHTLGLGEESLISLPVDSNRRIDVPAMKDALEEIQKTRDVFCVVATAGTTSTGSIDPVGAIAELCMPSQAWLHVDGAYGLAYGLVPEKKPLYGGIEIADSISWDPHKQMAVPIPSSILFVRCKEDFYRTTLYNDYFNRPEDTHPNPGLKSPPTTRPLSALSLVTSIRFQGLSKVIERLRSPLVAIRTTADFIKQQQDMEFIHEPDTGILCFRILPDGFPEDRLNHLQQNVYEQMLKQAERTVSICKLDGKTVLRLVAISPKVTGEDMIETVQYVRRLANTYKIIP